MDSKLTIPEHLQTPVPCQPITNGSVDSSEAVAADKPKCGSPEPQGYEGLWSEFFDFAQEVQQAVDYLKTFNPKDFPESEHDPKKTIWHEVMEFVNGMVDWTLGFADKIHRNIKKYQIIHVLDPFARLSDNKRYVEGLPESIERLYLQYMTVIAPQEFHWAANEDGLYQLWPNKASENFERLIIRTSKAYLQDEMEDMMETWKSNVANFDWEIAQRDEELNKKEAEKLSAESSAVTEGVAGNDEHNVRNIADDVGSDKDYVMAEASDASSDNEDDDDDDHVGPDDDHCFDDEQAWENSPEGRKHQGNESLIYGIEELLNGRKEGAMEQFMFGLGDVADEIFRFSPWGGAAGTDMDRLLRKDRYRRWF